MKKSIAILAAAVLLMACSKEPQEAQGPQALWPEEGKEQSLYINNGKIQLGVDLERGGAIFHFSESTQKTNLLNHADEGRFVQQSYYGDPDGSTWWNQQWCWNPVQGGGSGGRKARIMSKELTGTHLRIVTEPVLWASDEPAAECTMEEEITLEGDVAHIKYTFRNTGEGAHDHGERYQEVPAVFIDWDYPYFVRYSCRAPWTGDALTRHVPKLLTNAASGELEQLTESWAAYVNEEGWGVGVYSPTSDYCTLYRFGTGPGGPTSGSCSYFAPLKKMAVTKDMVFTYDVYMTIGTVEQIRSRFYEIHANAAAL